MGLKIDLGCGRNKRAGFVGVDNWSAAEADIHADIRYRIPGLEDGSAEYVLCSHVLEHIGGHGWRDVLGEMARLLAPGGAFEIRVPHPHCKDAMIHGHRWVLTPLWWEHLANGTIPHTLPLVFERIEEIPRPTCIEFCQRQGLDFEQWKHHLVDSHYETAIFGKRK